MAVSRGLHKVPGLGSGVLHRRESIDAAIAAPPTDRDSMGPLELIEKLITEHGSAAVLREHLGLLKAQVAAQEAANRDLQSQNVNLQANLKDCQHRLEQLQAAHERSQSGLLAANVCDHCASPRLRRTGTRPHPTFGRLGLREAVLTCDACGRETFIELPRGG